jgi:tetratricopeptide (TPR) repeat protein
MSELVGGRFEIAPPSKFEVRAGVDRETGAPVFVQSDFGSPYTPPFFLDDVAISCMAETVRELEDPRVAEVLWLDPVVIAAPPGPQETLTTAEWLEAAIEVIDVLVLLARRGVCAEPFRTWARRGSDRVEVKVLAPTPPQLQILPWQELTLPAEIERWLRQVFSRHREDVRAEVGSALKALPTDDGEAFLAGLAAHATPRGAARAREIAMPTRLPRVAGPLDFDRAVDAGEERLAQEHGNRGSGGRYTAYGLAAAYHHRACVAWEGGHRERALADLDRAVAIDPHTRYLTTRGLYARAFGDVEGARDLFDRAVAAIPPHREPGERWRVDEQQDTQERAARDAARTLHARAALRATEGDAAGALADLEEAGRRCSSAPIERALAALRAR